jgi:hypothetical protein
MLHTPLVDLFQRDQLPRDVRLLAAAGAVVARPVEQLGLLVLLSADRDEEIRTLAERTLGSVPRASLSAFLAHADVPGALRDFFARRGVPLAETPCTDLERPLFGVRDTADEDSAPDRPHPPLTPAPEAIPTTIPEKLKAAMTGSREARGVLIRDPNRLVAIAVLSSPKLTETEVEAFARMGSVSEDVLRTIARSRTWMKNYAIVHALTRNAKTPVAVSLPLLGRLNAGDLKRLAADRNIPEALRIAARKRAGAGS